MPGIRATIPCSIVQAIARENTQEPARYPGWLLRLALGVFEVVGGRRGLLAAGLAAVSAGDGEVGNVCGVESARERNEDAVLVAQRAEALADVVGADAATGGDGNVHGTPFGF